MSSILKLSFILFLGFLVIHHNPNPDNHLKEERDFSWSSLWNLDHHEIRADGRKPYDLQLNNAHVWEAEIDLIKRTHGLSEDSELVIRWIQKTYPDAPYMLHVANCESRTLVHRESNGKLLRNKAGGSDVGVLQINGVHKNDITRLGLNINKNKDYFTFTRILYDKRGVQPWYMSKHCWGDHYQRLTKT